MPREVTDFARRVWQYFAVSSFHHRTKTPLTTRNPAESPPIGEQSCEPYFFRAVEGSCEIPGLGLAPRAGLEPTTNRLTAGRSTIELPRNIAKMPGILQWFSPGVKSRSLKIGPDREVTMMRDGAKSESQTKGGRHGS